MLIQIKYSHELIEINANLNQRINELNLMVDNYKSGINIECILILNEY